MAKPKPSTTFGVIGLGRFGTALAKKLVEQGAEVLALDVNEEAVKEIRNYTEHAFVTDGLNKVALEEAGIQNCGTVVVCIGEKIDASILITLNVVELGVENVISKATSYAQGCVLEKIGAKVVYPEHDMAIRLAKKLRSTSVLEYISLSNDIEISELRVPDKMIGKSIIEIDFRRRFGLNIIAIESDNKTYTDINPDHKFKSGDIVIVIGKDESVKAFEKLAVK